MASDLTVEEDGPQLAERGLGLPGRADEGIADLQGQRPRGMIGALEEALVVASALFRW